ncbi:hypothetical protein B296_00051887, partial [Ensete ventricosum]
THDISLGTTHEGFTAAWTADCYSSLDACYLLSWQAVTLLRCVCSSLPRRFFAMATKEEPFPNYPPWSESNIVFAVGLFFVHPPRLPSRKRKQSPKPSIPPHQTPADPLAAGLLLLPSADFHAPLGQRLRRLGRIRDLRRSVPGNRGSVLGLEFLFRGDGCGQTGRVLVIGSFDRMALGDLMASGLSGSSASVSNHLDEFSGREDGDAVTAAEGAEPEVATPAGGNLPVRASAAATSMVYLPHTVVLSDFRHEGFEDCAAVGPSDNGLVSKWRPKDRVMCFPMPFRFAFQLICFSSLPW